MTLTGTNTTSLKINDLVANPKRTIARRSLRAASSPMVIVRAGEKISSTPSTKRLVSTAAKSSLRAFTIKSI